MYELEHRVTYVLARKHESLQLIGDGLRYKDRSSIDVVLYTPEKTSFQSNKEALDEFNKALNLNLFDIHAWANRINETAEKWGIPIRAEVTSCYYDAE